MNPEKQRIAIAEACGWTDIGPMAGDLCGVPPEGHIDEPARQLPDYLNDLNAMHEAEKTLTVLQQLHYYQNLVEALDHNPDGSIRFGVCMYWETIHASAAQRAEVFLRTIRKWEEDK